MTTIRKTSKEFTAAFENAKGFKVYSLDNGFSGALATEFPRWVDKQDVSLIKTATGYTARLHSNFWVEIAA